MQARLLFSPWEGLRSYISTRQCQCCPAKTTLYGARSGVHLSITRGRQTQRGRVTFATGSLRLGEASQASSLVACYLAFPTIQARSSSGSAS